MPMAETAAALTYSRSKPDSAALIRDHLSLVRKIAWHVYGRMSSATEIEDLVQIGMIALIEAANGYEDRGHAFATYATLRVRGAMIDHLRKSASQCRSAMTKRRDLARVIDEQRRLLGRDPNDAELASALGIDADALFTLKSEAQSAQHDSIDAVYSDHSMWFADGDDLADEQIDRSRLQSAVANAIRTLPEREAMVLQLYFVEEMNLAEIGETLEIGAARVCQIKKAALDKVRGLLGDWGED
jgi:RNA polymerase sigma factor FliA